MAACTYIFRLRAATLPRWPSSSTKCPCEVVKGRGVSSSGPDGLHAAGSSPRLGYRDRDMGVWSEQTPVSACTRPKRGCRRPRRSGPLVARPALAGQGPRSLSDAPITEFAFRRSHTGTGRSPRDADQGSPTWQRPGISGQWRSGSDPVPHRRSRSDCPAHERRCGPPDLRRRTGSPGRAGADRRSQRSRQDLPRPR